MTCIGCCACGLTTPPSGSGVDTALVTGSGAPAAGLVYKLSARSTDPGGGSPSLPVAKRSAGKPTIGGRKWAARQLCPDGVAIAEVIRSEPPEPDPADERPLLVELVRDGHIFDTEPLAVARERHQRALAELPRPALRLSQGHPAIPTLFGADLEPGR